MRQALLPWAEAGSRFINLFEALAINVLLATNIKRAAQLLRISWDQAQLLMERAVVRGRAALAECVDLFQASYNQRRGGGIELQNCNHTKTCLWVQES